MTSGKLFNGCLIVLGIFVAIVFGLGYVFSGSESSTTEKTPSHECQGSVQKDGTIIFANKYTTRSFHIFKGTDKNETYTFYPNDGDVYNKILSGLLHLDTN